jgi:citrate lyase subunit beta/citryl-CoA lyase
MLFVPANRERYLRPAVDSGADAVIIDLEDSVPAAEKPAARAALPELVGTLRALRPDVSVYVRPNAWATGFAAEDLEQCVLAGVDALYLPKILEVFDVVRTATILDFLEARYGVADRRTGLAVALETAQSLVLCEQLAGCSDRVETLVGATARNADVARSLGFQWTREGLETLYLRSRAVAAARAAGLTNPIGGLWQDVRDLDGLREFSAMNRRLGFGGQIVIHPSHVHVVNEAFSLSDEEVEYQRGLVAAYRTAESDGSGAALYDGEMIDLAHARTAEALLALHEARSMAAASAGARA